MRKTVLATRGSELALAQAEEAAVAMKAAEPSLPVEFKIVSTRGDKDRMSALTEIGGDGLFVRGIEKELLAGTADIAVHCGKDLPYRIADGLTIAAVLPAASAEDVLLSRVPAAELSRENNGSPVIGTGSPRRRIEIAGFYPHAEFRECRGNITTRIGKLRAGEYDAIVLAKAGMERLSLPLAGLYTREFTVEECIPAACQGILVIECRKDDREMIGFLKQLEDARTRMRFDTERAVFCALQADCRIPAGVHVRITTNDAETVGQTAAREDAETVGQITAREDAKLSIRAMLGGKYAFAEGKSAEREKLVKEVTATLWQGM